MHLFTETWTATSLKIADFEKYRNIGMKVLAHHKQMKTDAKFTFDHYSMKHHYNLLNVVFYANEDIIHILTKQISMYERVLKKDVNNWKFELYWNTFDYEWGICRAVYYKIYFGVSNIDW